MTGNHSTSQYVCGRKYGESGNAQIHKARDCLWIRAGCGWWRQDLLRHVNHQGIISALLFFPCQPTPEIKWWPEGKEVTVATAGLWLGLFDSWVRGCWTCGCQCTGETVGAALCSVSAEAGGAECIHVHRLCTLWFPWCSTRVNHSGTQQSKQKVKSMLTILNS